MLHAKNKATLGGLVLVGSFNGNPITLRKTNMVCNMAFLSAIGLCIELNCTVKYESILINLQRYNLQYLVSSCKTVLNFPIMSM